MTGRGGVGRLGHVTPHVAPTSATARSTVDGVRVREGFEMLWERAAPAVFETRHFVLMPTPALKVDPNAVEADDVVRTRSFAGGLVALTVALGWVALALRIVLVERIGPTVATVSASRGWGIHTGDALAVPATLVALAAFAVAIGLFHHALGRREVGPLRPARVVSRSR